MNRKLFAAFTLATLVAIPSFAADTYAVDASHSAVSFQVRHLVTNVRGRFNDFNGTINLDPANLEKSSVEFRVKAASIDTANEDRDKHLRAEDFFHVEKYPEITFKSTSIKKTGKDTYAVTGDFTMRGVTKRITLPVTYLGTARDPWGKDKAGFETATTLDRKEYGIVWNAAVDNGGVILGDDVKIAINLEANKAKPDAKKGK
ncbi:MAG TPA: YceI family protein [Thermoanaerobaculia bacterium]|nr:YceI family protein [Thermoanaerobaculia bacterium]